WQQAEAENNVGLDLLDHLTHNVKRGQMRVWSEFYRELFGFEEQKYFDIKGQATGLFSQAMIAPDKAIRIPLNESQDDQSQIEEFIRDYHGEGIQHLALTTHDIYGTVEKLRARGVRLQDTIETYYELVDKRVPDHGENLERLRRNRILIDGSRAGRAAGRTEFAAGGAVGALCGAIFGHRLHRTARRKSAVLAISLAANRQPPPVRAV